MSSNDVQDTITRNSRFRYLCQLGVRISSPEYLSILQLWLHPHLRDNQQGVGSARTVQLVHQQSMARSRDIVAVACYHWHETIPQTLVSKQAGKSLNHT